MNGCAAFGKFDDEKKTPEKTHIGSIAMFMSPDAPSIVRGREAINSPIPPNASAPSKQMSASKSHEPRIGTPKTNNAKASSAATSTTSCNSRFTRNDHRYSAFDIGVDTRRLSSF